MIVMYIFLLFSVRNLSIYADYQGTECAEGQGKLYLCGEKWSWRIALVVLSHSKLYVDFIKCPPFCSTTGIFLLSCVLLSVIRSPEKWEAGHSGLRSKSHSFRRWKQDVVMWDFRLLRPDHSCHSRVGETRESEWQLHGRWARRAGETIYSNNSGEFSLKPVQYMYSTCVCTLYTYRLCTTCTEKVWA